MRSRSLTGPALTIGVVVAIGVLTPWADIATWVGLQQREFQDAMVRSLQRTEAGEPAAIWSLCLATAAYGFVHALGPGHGKVLLGGAAIASGATLRRMIVLSLVASLAQSGCAILLIATLLQGFSLASADAVWLTEAWLAPISHVAVAAIGAALVIRGVGGLRRLSRAAALAHGACGCGHDHGVSLSELKSLQTTRDVAALIGSIAIRPCTGALVLLVIAARLNIFMIGVLATLTMGLGTALFNMLTAGSGVAARHLAYVGGAVSGPRLQGLSAGLHIAGGVLVLWFGLLLLDH